MESALAGGNQAGEIANIHHIGTGDAKRNRASVATMAGFGLAFRPANA
jgi:hypothetical protein